MDNEWKVFRGTIEDYNQNGGMLYKVNDEYSVDVFKVEKELYEINATFGTITDYEMENLSSYDTERFNKELDGKNDFGEFACKVFDEFPEKAVNYRSYNLDNPNTYQNRISEAELIDWEIKLGINSENINDKLKQLSISNLLNTNNFEECYIDEQRCSFIMNFDTYFLETNQLELLAFRANALKGLEENRGIEYSSVSSYLEEIQLNININIEVSPFKEPVLNFTDNKNDFTVTAPLSDKFISLEINEINEFAKEVGGQDLFERLVPDKLKEAVDNIAHQNSVEEIYSFNYKQNENELLIQRSELPYDFISVEVEKDFIENLDKYIKENDLKMNNWINYGDVNFNEYGGTLLKQLDEENFEVFHMDENGDKYAYRAEVNINDLLNHNTKEKIAEYEGFNVDTMDNKDIVLGSVNLGVVRDYALNQNGNSPSLSSQVQITDMELIEFEKNMGINLHDINVTIPKFEDMLNYLDFADSEEKGNVISAEITTDDKEYLALLAYRSNILKSEIDNGNYYENISEFMEDVGVENITSTLKVTEDGSLAYIELSDNRNNIKGEAVLDINETVALINMTDINEEMILEIKKTAETIKDESYSLPTILPYETEIGKTVIADGIHNIPLDTVEKEFISVYKDDNDNKYFYFADNDKSALVSEEKDFEVIKNPIYNMEQDIINERMLDCMNLQNDEWKEMYVSKISHMNERAKLHEQNNESYTVSSKETSEILKRCKDDYNIDMTEKNNEKQRMIKE